MRWSSLGLACLALAGCSKAPEDDSPGETATGASGVAFAYRYDFRLPSTRIADVQEAHAQACERLGSVRCRITGMSYRRDDAGQIAASLEVRTAAAIARGFGRTGVQTVEQGGGALTGAEIIGTDARTTVEGARRDTTDARTELAEVERQLASDGLSDGARRDLLARRAGLVVAARESDARAADAQASIAITPISFSYRAGTGVGLSARLSEAGQAGYASLTWTLATALTVLAYLGPPLTLLFLLALLWHRLGRHWWARVFPNVSAG